MTYSTHTVPPPLQPIPSDSYGSTGSTDSVPPLVSHSSSDSGTSMLPSMNSYDAHPETPQINASLTLTQSHSTSSSPGRYGGNEKATEVVYGHNSYSTSTSGGGRQGYWPAADGTMPSPGSYSALSGQMGAYGESPHQLPHVHQTISRQPSSNDLRVMYPALST
ncbi:hypothetical protein BCR39DRAFT_310319 [Naematelia encephala]|uniref:Uncharacterized protein n=1 Tax=Naematelia encephala TaxID=71784 RepID=A0A1Y2ARY7_9TREE|nr:hypothetical protein BCR39DRAFT_310319 [Naematelia encephala]